MTIATEEEVDVNVTREVTSTPVIAVPPPTKSQVAYTAVFWYNGVVQVVLMLVKLGTIWCSVASSTATAKLVGTQIRMFTYTTQSMSMSVERFEQLTGKCGHSYQALGVSATPSQVQLPHATVQSCNLEFGLIPACALLGNWLRPKSH